MLGAKPREIDPAQAVLEEIHYSAGNVEALKKKVAELEESALVWGKVMEAHEEKDGGGPTGNYSLTRSEYRAQTNMWYELLDRERKHLANLSLSAIKVGIEERKVRIAERGMQAFDEALRKILAELGHDPADERVRTIVSGSLEEVLALTVGVSPDTVAGAQAAGDQKVARLERELAGRTTPAGPGDAPDPVLDF